jgi:hypothetical protein
MTGFAPEPRYYTYTSFWRAYPALAWLLIAVVALALLRVAAAAISARRGRKDGRPKLSGYLMLGIVIIGGVCHGIRHHPEYGERLYRLQRRLA